MFCLCLTLREAAAPYNRWTAATLAVHHWSSDHPDPGWIFFCQKQLHRSLQKLSLQQDHAKTMAPEQEAISDS